MQIHGELIYPCFGGRKTTISDVESISPLKGSGGEGLKKTSQWPYKQQASTAGNACLL
jgi:hypothetical protein